MPLAVRRARLAGLDSEGLLLSSTSVVVDRKRRQVAQSENRAKKTKSSDLARKVDQLSSAVELLLPLLAKAQPAEALETVRPESCVTASPSAVTGHEFDVVSVAASDSLFDASPAIAIAEGNVHVDQSHNSGSETASVKSGHSSSVVASLEGTLKAMLARINLDPPQPTVSSENVFLRRAQSTSFAMPQCKDFTSVLVAALQGSAKASRPDQLARALAVMQDPDMVGLGSMPSIEPSVAALIVSPDEALRENVRCPNVECRRTDELLSRAYNSTASLGRVSNSLAHMLVALHSSLSEVSSDPLVSELTELALQAMGVVANHCGITLGTLVQARRQVWLAQSSLPEVCRNNLRRLPLVPGRIFGPAAQEALDRRVSVSETRSRHVGSASGSRPPPATSGARYPNIGVRSTCTRPQHFQHRHPQPPPRRGGAQLRGHQSHTRFSGPQRRPPTSTEKRSRDR